MRHLPTHIALALLVACGSSSPPDNLEDTCAALRDAVGGIGLRGEDGSPIGVAMSADATECGLAPTDGDFYRLMSTDEHFTLAAKVRGQKILVILGDTRTTGPVGQSFHALAEKIRERLHSTPTFTPGPNPIYTWELHRP